MGYLIVRSSFVNIINFKLDVSSFYKPQWPCGIWIQAVELLRKDEHLLFFVVMIQKQFSFYSTNYYTLSTQSHLTTCYASRH